jgi:hypothetical protein
MVQGSEVLFKGEYRTTPGRGRISNVEGMYSVDYIKKIEQAYFAKLATKAKSETTLRYFGL